MASVNKVILVGNLGSDPETRYMPSGDAVTNISIATTDKWKDKQTGEQKEQTEWHRVSFFGKLAEVAGQYLKKGSQVYVEGSLRTRKYEKDGQTHYSTEIRADVLQMLGGRRDDDSGGQQQGYQRPSSNALHQMGNRNAQNQSGQSYRVARDGSAPAPSGGFGDMDDDIPF